MKAMVYHKYGSPDVLELQEIPKPVVNDDQVLVRVHAASANWLDWHFLTGTPFLARLPPKPPNKTDLVFIKELLEAGTVAPTIDRRYSLSELPDALRYLEKGHAQGKVVVTV